MDRSNALNDDKHATPGFSEADGRPGAQGRLLHHSTTINISGESYRLKDKRKAGLPPKPIKPKE
jgi:hypothetical protein